MRVMDILPEPKTAWGLHRRWLQWQHGRAVLAYGRKIEVESYEDYIHPYRVPGTSWFQDSNGEYITEEEAWDEARPEARP